MKNSLDFNVPFVASWNNMNFIICFTSVYLFVERIDVSGIKKLSMPA